MLMRIVKNRNSTEARALTTTGTLPSPAAVTLKPIEMPPSVMPKARSRADPSALTMK